MVLYPSHAFFRALRRLSINAHLAVAAHVSAQNCTLLPDSGFHAVGGISSGTYAAALSVFNDASGDGIFIGGQFNAAGALAPLNGIVKWNGESFSQVGIGFTSSAVVRALTVFDDGTGAALFAGGMFNTADNLPAAGFAKWDGNHWEPIAGGPANNIRALLVHDDGTGPALFVGGTAPPYIMKWNGTTWFTLGSGVNGEVTSLASYDSGNGLALYVGGSFTQAGPLTVNRIARWDGTWQALGSGCNNRINALCAMNFGAGMQLYAGGAFTVAGGVASARIASWNGSEWSSLGSGANQEIYALASFDDGSGPALFAGGQFSSIGGVAAAHVARWNDSTWQSTGAGLNNTVSALQPLTMDSRTELFAAGLFTQNGSGLGTIQRVARWNGSQWLALGGNGLFNSAPSTMMIRDWGQGPRVLLSGGFSNAGGMPSQSVASWDGMQWNWLGGGTTGFVAASAVLDNKLFVAGQITSIGGLSVNNIAQWDGASWSALGSGLSSSVKSITVYEDDDGTAVYAAGLFTQAGGVAVKRIAKWDGLSWSGLNAVGTGPDTAWIDVLSVYDDGSGPELFVGGPFSSIDGNNALRYLVKWNGQNWSLPDGGVSGPVEALDILDEGEGQSLYVRGTFTLAGGLPASRLVRYTDGVWDNLLGGLNGVVNDLVIYDNGTGPRLYVTGDFTSAGGQPCSRIASYGEEGWEPLGPLGLSGAGTSLAVFDDGTGPQLFVTGEFLEAGGLAAHGIAKWNGQSWSVVGTGMTLYDIGYSGRLETFGDGPSAMLCVGGNFTALAGVTASRFTVVRACQPTQPPLSFTLISPVETFGYPLNPTLNWSKASGLFVRYHVKLASDSELQNVLFSKTSLVGTSMIVPSGFLKRGNRYYWSVIAENPIGSTLCVPSVAMFGTDGGPDVDANGIVSVSDLLYVINGWGDCPVTTIPCPADVNGDGMVNVSDLLQIIAAWGPYP